MTAGWPAGVRACTLPEVDSTNAEALRRAAQGETGPLWIRAEAQTAGRGRRGRAWQSQGGNLFATLLVRPPKPPRECAQLSFAAALAVSDLLAGLAPGAEIRVKWPNDVLADGGKIVGILLEAAGGALAIGIGINLTSAPQGTPYRAASLADFVVPPPPQEALQGLAAAFDGWYGRWQTEGFAPLREAWLARAAGLGGPIRVRTARGEIEGRFDGLDAGGALLLGRGGAIKTIAAGEVYFT